MERLLKKLEFIENTLREEFKTLSKKELNDILTFVYEEQIRNDKPILSLQTLNEARILCGLHTGKLGIVRNEPFENRTIIIKEDDEYALIFKRAFGILNEFEKATIIENVVKSDEIEMSEDYVRAARTLVKNICEEDEYIANIVQKALFPIVVSESYDANTIEDLVRIK